MTPAASACPKIVPFLLASGASRRNKATLAAIKPPAVIGFIAIMPGAKFLSGSICRIHPVRTVVAIAAVRRLAATGAIWVIGAFKRIWFEDKGSQFRAKAWSALKKGFLLFESKALCFQRVAKPRNDAIVLTETENHPTNVIRPSIKTEIFVCDECGQRKRLKTSSRHWCDSCNHGSPVEMRPARDKRVVHPQKAAPTH